MTGINRSFLLRKQRSRYQHITLREQRGSYQQVTLIKKTERQVSTGHFY
jgi:hypothetical protein